MHRDGTSNQFFQQDWHPPAHGPHETPALSWAGPSKPFLPSREKKEVGPALEYCLEGPHGPCIVHVQLSVAARRGSGSQQDGGTGASISEVPDRPALGHGRSPEFGSPGEGPAQTQRSLAMMLPGTDTQNGPEQPKLLMLRDCPIHLRQRGARDQPGAGNNSLGQGDLLPCFPPPRLGTPALHSWNAAANFLGYTLIVGHKFLGIHSPWLSRDSAHTKQR